MKRPHACVRIFAAAASSSYCSSCRWLVFTAACAGGRRVRRRPLPRLRRPGRAPGVPQRGHRVPEGGARHHRHARRGERPRRPDRPALDVVRRWPAARPLPHQLPLLRAVRGARRARADPATASTDSDAFEEEDFYAKALDAFRVDGELVCLPQNISSLVVYYNRDLFRQGRRERAAPGWTWDDMVEKAIALTRDTDGDGNVDQYGLGVEPTVIRIAPFVWSNGGEIVDDDERADPLHARHARGAGGAAEVLRPARSSTRRPDGGGDRVRGRRVALPERTHGDGAVVAPRDADVPDDHRLRLGHRAAAAASASPPASSTPTRTA